MDKAGMRMIKTVGGIHTHHQRRSATGEYSDNVGCLEGINPFLIEEVLVLDGVNRPADRRP